MGYSNNKWRKILYILMIINLCFILFAKFSKVFASFSIVNENNNATFNISDDFTNKYPYYCFCTTQNGEYIYIIMSNSPLTTNSNDPDSYAFYTYFNENNTGMIYIGGPYTYVQNTLNNNNLPEINVNLNQFTTNGYGAMRVFYSNHDIKNKTTGDVIIDDTSVRYPEIANTQQQLETLDFDVLSINAWSYSNEDFDVLLYDLNYGSDTTDSLYPVNVITLNKDTLYYNSTLTADPDKNAIYWIPIEELGFNWVKGNKYGIKFAVRDYGIQGGGGFRGEDYIYQYIGEETVFTISNTVPDSTITALNNSTQNNIQKNQHEEIVNNMNNITNNLDNVNDALTNTTPDNSVSSDIDSALNFNNQNTGLNNLNNGFFSRLTSMLSNLLGYNLGEDSSVSIPLPHSNKSIVLHSKTIYDNVTGNLRLIINAFWVYIFSFYMWRFINKIYIAISTGNILDTFSSSGEAITNDML